MKNIKKFVLTISERFPSTHFMKGEETGFIEKIFEKTKIHTIRKNYLLWKERIEQIQNGEAILSIRVWSGKPYKSPQKEIIQIDRFSGIGVQLLFLDLDSSWCEVSSDDKTVEYDIFGIYDLSKNDGLTILQFQEWFKGIDKEEPLAIIHFTDFRY